MSYVEASIHIDAPPDRIYGMAVDMESYPDFMSDVEKVTVVERSPGMTVTDWVTSVEGIPICWREEDRFDEAGKRIEYKLIQGDLDKFEGEWSFQPEAGGTKVTLTVDFDFGMPTLADLLGPILDLKVKENSQMMLQGMKARAEQRGGDGG